MYFPRYSRASVAVLRFRQYFPPVTLCKDCLSLHILNVVVTSDKVTRLRKFGPICFAGQNGANSEADTKPPPSQRTRDLGYGVGLKAPYPTSSPALTSSMALPAGVPSSRVLHLEDCKKGLMVGLHHIASARMLSHADTVSHNTISWLRNMHQING